MDIIFLLVNFKYLLKHSGHLMWNMLASTGFLLTIVNFSYFENFWQIVMYVMQLFIKNKEIISVFLNLYWMILPQDVVMEMGYYRLIKWDWKQIVIDFDGTSYTFLGPVLFLLVYILIVKKLKVLNYGYLRVETAIFFRYICNCVWVVILYDALWVIMLKGLKVVDESGDLSENWHWHEIHLILQIHLTSPSLFYSSPAVFSLIWIFSDLS